jgi:hypothetical protein
MCQLDNELAHANSLFLGHLCNGSNAWISLGSSELDSRRLRKH